MAAAEFFKREDPLTGEKWYVSRYDVTVRYSIGKRDGGYRVEDGADDRYAVVPTANEARELARWLAGHEDHGNYEADPTTFYEWRSLEKLEASTPTTPQNAEPTTSFSDDNGIAEETPDGSSPRPANPSTNEEPPALVEDDDFTKQTDPETGIVRRIYRDNPLVEYYSNKTGDRFIVKDGVDGMYYPVDSEEQARRWAACVAEQGMVGAAIYKQRQDYLFELPAWDGVDRVGQLVEHLRTDPKMNRFEVRADVQLWLVTLAAKMLSPHNAVDRVLVLKGPQCIGKSHLVRWLCPKEEWYGDLIREVSENPENLVWDLVVANKGKGRVFAVTLNHIDLPFIEVLTVANGLFLPIALEDIDHDYTAIDKDQLWAQVYQNKEAWSQWKEQETDDDDDSGVDEQVAADLCGGDDPPPWDEDGVLIEHCEDEGGPYVWAHPTQPVSWGSYKQEGF